MPKNSFCNFCKLQYDILNMAKKQSFKGKNMYYELGTKCNVKWRFFAIQSKSVEDSFKNVISVRRGKK